jgi:hypothetical protein
MIVYNCEILLQNIGSELTPSVRAELEKDTVKGGLLVGTPIFDIFFSWLGIAAFCSLKIFVD